MGIGMDCNSGEFHRGGNHIWWRTGESVSESWYRSACYARQGKLLLSDYLSYKRGSHDQAWEKLCFILSLVRQWSSGYDFSWLTRKTCVQFPVGAHGLKKREPFLISSFLKSLPRRWLVSVLRGGIQFAHVRIDNIRECTMSFVLKIES